MFEQLHSTSSTFENHRLRNNVAIDRSIENQEEQSLGYMHGKMKIKTLQGPFLFHDLY